MRLYIETPENQNQELEPTSEAKHGTTLWLGAMALSEPCQEACDQVVGLV
jgi:hypothetical protein